MFCNIYFSKKGEEVGEANKTLLNFAKIRATADIVKLLSVACVNGHVLF